MLRVNIATLCRQCLPFSYSPGPLGIAYYSTSKRGPKSPAAGTRNYEIGGIYSGVGAPSPQPSFLKALKDVKKVGKDESRNFRGGRDRRRERSDRDDGDRRDKRDRRDQQNVDEEGEESGRGEWKGRREGKGKGDRRDRNRRDGNRGEEKRGERPKWKKKEKKGVPEAIEPEKEWGKPVIDTKLKKKAGEQQQQPGRGNERRERGPKKKKPESFVIYKPPPKVEVDRGQFENTMFVTRRRPHPKFEKFAKISEKSEKVAKSEEEKTKEVEVKDENKKEEITKIKKETFVNSMFKRRPPVEEPEEELDDNEEIETKEEGSEEVEEIGEKGIKKEAKVKEQKEGKEEKKESFAKLVVQGSEDEMRMDRWIGLHFPSLPHSHLQKMLRSKLISYSTTTEVVRKKATSEMRVKAGYTIFYPSHLVSADAKPEKKVPVRLSDEEVEVIKSWVVHKDDDILIINKPEGLAVQGGTKVNRHLAQLLPALRFDKTEDPRLVHRLDRETSGVLVLARHRRAAVKLTELFKTNKMTKIYWALVAGIPEVSIGKINMPLEKVTGVKGEERIVPREKVTKTAKPATTDFSVAEELSSCSFVVLAPNTGRTHQLRVHCASALGTHILGDRKYGKGSNEQLEELFGDVNKLHLHARRIIFKHPFSDQRINVAVSLPPHMLSSWKLLGLNPNYKEKISDLGTKPDLASEEKLRNKKIEPAKYGNAKTVRKSIWSQKISRTPRRDMKMAKAIKMNEKKERRKKNKKAAELAKPVKKGGKDGKEKEKESKGEKRRKSRNAVAQEQKYRSMRRVRPVKKLAPKIK